MATVSLSPTAVQHFLDNFGNALNGGKLFTYAAGTTTKLATYTDSTGATTNTNPIILNTRGEASVWLQVGVAYKLVLCPSTDTDPPTTPIWTQDNVNNPGTASIANIAALRAMTSSPTIVWVQGYTSTFDGGEGFFTLGAAGVDNGGTIIVTGGGTYHRETGGQPYSVMWFGAKGVSTDDTAAIVSADLAASTAGVGVYFPPGTYGINNTSPHFQGVNWTGAGSNLSILAALAQSYPNGASLVAIVSKNGWRITGMGFDFSAGTFPPGVGNPGNVMTMFNIVTCSKFTIDHCAFTGIQAHTGGISVNGGNDWAVNFNYFNMPSPTGTAWNQSLNVSNSAGSVTDWQFCNNVQIGTGMFSEGSYGIISGNYSTGVAYGAALACGPNAGCVSNKFIGNTCLSSTGRDVNGSYVNGIENWSYNAIIVGNVCNNNSGHGIGNGGGQAVISGNVCNQNGQTPGSNAGGINMVSIVSPAFAATECVVTGNICQDFQVSPTQAYGYLEQDNAGAMIRNTVMGNNFNGNKLGTMLVASGEMAFIGPQLAGGYGPVTPGGITSGTPVTFTFSVLGAALGDVVTAGFSNNLNAVVLNAYAAGTNTVVVVFSNPGGGTITLGAGTVYLTVAKPPGYASLG